MISKAALEAYTNRQLDNFDWIKKVDRKMLEQEIATLPAKPALNATLFLHQLASFYLGATLEQFLYFLDLGTGKTLLSLALFSYWKQIGRVNKALVVASNVVGIEEWISQTKEFTNYKCISLYGSRQQRMEALQTEGDLYVINYEGLQVMMTELVKVPKKRAKKRTLMPEKAQEFTQNFQMVVFDESHRAKSHTSLTFQLCSQFYHSCNYRYALTGTPFGRDPIDLWAQFYIVDRGETLGKTLGPFRETFFTQKKNYFGIVGNRPKTSVEYKFDTTKKRALYKMIKNRSIRYEDTECAELPPVRHIIVPTPLSSDSLAYYHQLQREAFESVDTQQVRKNFYSKYRQVASGFVYVKDEEDDVREAITFSEAPKLDKLVELIEDMQEDAKMVVFHVFDHSGRMICERLKKEKISYSAINSTEDDPTGALTAFKTNPSKRVIVINIARGNASLNLQVARYMCFYEPTDRPIWQRQAEKRVHRTGQTRRVTYYHFLVKGTVEEKIREFLLEGKSLFDALIEGKIGLKDISKLSL